MSTNETSQSEAGLPAGVYRHKETGEELILSASSRLGNPQAAAATRLGFEYVGPAPSNVVQPVDPHYTPPASDPSAKTVEELEAELEAAKELRAQSVEGKKAAEAINEIAEQSVENVNPAPVKENKKNKGAK